MTPETTAPVQVPAGATDDVVDFILQNKAAEDVASGGLPIAPSQPQQVDLNPKPEVQPTGPTQQELDAAATEEKLKKEIEDQKKFDEEADNLLKELGDKPKEEPKKAEKPKTDEPESPMKEVLGKISQLSIEEQEQFITFVDELQKSHAELSAEKIKSSQRISDLEYENQILRDSSKKYIEKTTSLEQDEARNKIPDGISELVVSFKDFSTKNDDFTKKQYRKELIRATEKEFGRSLNDYIGDVYIGSNDVITGKESFSMDLPPKSSQTVAKQEETKRLKVMEDIF